MAKRLIADFGVVKSSDLGLTFYNYDIPAPDVQENKLTVTGRDGDIDLTSVYGKVTYRSREITLYMKDNRDLATRQEARRKLETAIHGKDRDLVISDADDYTIKGRWSVEVDEGNSVTLYEIVGDCYPFRHRGTYIYRVNAAGGIEIMLEGGDKMTRPIFEVYRPTLISYEGSDYQLNPGTYYIEDLYFHEGWNIVYIDTDLDGGSMTWQDLINQGVTWGQLGTKRLSEWRWGSEPPNEPYTWQELIDMGVTWGELGTKALIEWQHPVTPENENYMVYIQYDREDF